MGNLIIKLHGEGKDFYLDWSTVIDAPISNGMSLEEFKEYYKQLYGEEKVTQLSERLKRVEETGCSARYTTLDHILSCNRAGENERRISKKEILRKYCLESSTD